MNLPNKLTVFRILLIPFFIAILAINHNFGTVQILNSSVNINWIIADIVFAIASITDFLDGQIARKYKLVTNFGKFADPLADKLLVMTAFIFLTSLSVVPAWMTAVIIIRELSITGLRTLIVENNGKVLAAELPGKLKTFSQMIAILALYLKINVIGIPVLYFAVFMTIISGIDYFYKNKSVFSDGM